MLWKTIVGLFAPVITLCEKKTPNVGIGWIQVVLEELIPP
jgi:hypothetical protein